MLPETPIGTVPLLQTEPLSNIQLDRFAEPVFETFMEPRNRFLGSLKGLQIRALTTTLEGFPSRHLKSKFAFLKVDNLIIIPVSNSPHTGMYIKQIKKKEDREQEITGQVHQRKKQGQIIKSDAKA